MRSDASRHWTGHVVVCGLNAIALRTIEQLCHIGLPVVVVDDVPDPRLVAALGRWSVPWLAEDPRLPETLDHARVGAARAVVCVERSDLLTLETALLVRERHPQVRVVVQMANPGVGHALVDVTGPGSVLDVAELTAPALVEACLRRTSHGIDIEGERFVAAEVVAGQPGTLRRLYGDLAPVAVVHDGDHVAVCPGRDHAVQPGDRVTLLGTPSDLEQAGIAHGGTPARERPTRPFRLFRAVRRLAVALVAETDRALLASLGALVTLVVLSTIVLLFGYRRMPDGTHLSIVEAVYFTVETVATVGYGDFSFAAQSGWLQVFAIVLIVLGVILLTTLFALFTNLLVSRGIAQSLGRYRIPGMRDHVVVVGFGSVGLRVVEQLVAERVPVVVVERDEGNRYLDRARALGVPVVAGDATQAATLESVNVRACRAVAVLTSDDLANIESGLAARDVLGERWNDVPVVLRLFDRTLARTVENSFGFSSVRSTSELAAPWFVGAALGLSIISTFSVARQPFLVGSLRIGSEGGLVGLTMAELSARTRVVALRRSGGGASADGASAGGGGELEHPPRRGTRFAAGDVAYIVGPYEELLSVLLREAQGPSVAPTSPSPLSAGDGTLDGSATGERSS